MAGALSARQWAAAYQMFISRTTLHVLEHFSNATIRGDLALFALSTGMFEIGFFSKLLFYLFCCTPVVWNCNTCTTMSNHLACVCYLPKDTARHIHTAHHHLSPLLCAYAVYKKQEQWRQMSKATHHHLHHTYIRHRWQYHTVSPDTRTPEKGSTFFSLHSLSSGSRLKGVPKVVRRHHPLHICLIVCTTHGSWDAHIHTRTFAFPTIIIRNCTCVHGITMVHVFFCSWLFALRYTTDHPYCQITWHCHCYCKNVLICHPCCLIHKSGFPTHPPQKNE